MEAEIDWRRPWLRALQELGQQAEALIHSGTSVAQALQHLAESNGLLPGWRFVSQQELPEGMAYEAFIRAEKAIPTRDNLHDFFNGLIWLHWPQLKQRLNAMQAAAIAAQGVGAQRGKLRDSITVLDENGALLLAPQSLCDALRERRWQDLFLQQRALWAQAQLFPIGHALLEKLVQPRKAITAHVICVPLEQVSGLATQARADAWLSLQIEQGTCKLENKPYLPLPVAGIPGWWHESQNFSFYDDSVVFRAPRTSQTPQQQVQPERDLV